MTRAVLTAAISLLISCHSPSMAPRVTEDPLTTGSAPAEPAALEHAEPPPPDPAAPIVPEPPPWTPEPGVRLSSEPDDPPAVALCCDRFSALCYRDAATPCASATSSIVVCPEVSVRTVDKSADIVICAE